MLRRQARRHVDGGSELSLVRIARDSHPAKCMNEKAQRTVSAADTLSGI